MTISGYIKYAGKHWRADELNMVNHQNGKTAKIKFSNYTFMTGLVDNDFTKNSFSLTLYLKIVYVLNIYRGNQDGKRSF